MRWRAICDAGKARGRTLAHGKSITFQRQVAIIATELWDKDFLDMEEPAYIAFDGNSGGEFAFCCVTGNLHCRPTSCGIDFTWEGSAEMDRVSGDGWAKLQRDGSLKGQIRFHNGDDSTFKARRW